MIERQELTGVPNSDVPRRKRAFERQGWTVTVIEESPGPNGTSTLSMTKESETEAASEGPAQAPQSQPRPEEPQQG